MNAQSKIQAVQVAPQIAAAPSQQTQPQKSRIEQLLECEAAMREAATATELSYLIVNEWRTIISAGQIYILEAGVSGAQWVTFASDVTKVDPRSPLCTKLVEQLGAVARDLATHEWQPVAFNDLIVEGRPYPYTHGITAKIKFKDNVEARQILALSFAPFGESERVIATRLGLTAGHAFWALSPKKSRKPFFTNKRKFAALSGLSLVLIGFVPVPLSILAPVEIVAKNPFIAAAPISGVIDNIDVEPNTRVSAGTILFRLNDTELKATLDLAEKSVAVAQARLRRTQQGAGGSPELRREAGIALSELALSVAERDGAKARLERTIVRSPDDGVVMFNRREDWIGKPVNTGERVMEIADPAEVEASIEVSLADSIVLDNPTGITLFLDSDPLKALKASFKSAGYQSEMSRDQQLAFPVRAKIETGESLLRIGQRGTAQMRTAKVSLAYFLFRRPLAALRQKVGL